MTKRSEIKRAGFTLIELLVVIAIIALLLAILVPSLSMAKEKAKLLMCTNHARQLMMAELLYANDNGGFLPPVNFGQMYVHYMGLDFSYWPGYGGGWVPTVWHDALDKYIKDARRGQADYSMTCPNFKRMHPSIKEWGVDGTPYGQNGFMDNDGDGFVASGEPTPDVYAGKPINTAKVKHAGELVIISESYGFPGIPKMAWAIGGPLNPAGYEHFPELRHKSGFPIGFLDGHAKSYKAVENENTDKVSVDPIYWPDIPDNWWLIH